MDEKLYSEFLGAIVKFEGDASDENLERVRVMARDLYFPLFRDRDRVQVPARAVGAFERAVLAVSNKRERLLERKRTHFHLGIQHLILDAAQMHDDRRIAGILAAERLLSKILESADE